MTNTWKNTRPVVAYCNRQGEISFGSAVPRNAIALAQNTEERLRETLSVMAPLDCDHETFLVPGVSGTRSDEAATAAVWEFQERLQLELLEKEAA